MEKPKLDKRWFMRPCKGKNHLGSKNLLRVRVLGDPLTMGFNLREGKAIKAVEKKA
jgi:hypothetical protein